MRLFKTGSLARRLLLFKTRATFRYYDRYQMAYNVERVVIGLHAKDMTLLVTVLNHVVAAKKWSLRFFGQKYEGYSATRPSLGAKKACGKQ